MYSWCSYKMPHSYENYDDKSSTYTALRRPLASKLIARHISGGDHKDADLSSIYLLDSGCGTGNYTVEFLKSFGLKHVHCTDYNDAMVDVARKNVEAALEEMKFSSPTKSEGPTTCDSDQSPDIDSAPTSPVVTLKSNVPAVTFSSDNVCDMTDRFATATFDAVINNQVVHHLRPDQNYLDLNKM